MLTVGYDPGPLPTDKTHVVWDGKQHKPELEVSEKPDAIVIEVPVSQGQLRKQQPIYDTCITAGFIAGYWWMATTLKGDVVPIYLVPRRVLMAQFGLPTSAGDSGLAKHLCGLRIAEGKYDKAGGFRVTTPGLTTTHQRAALMAAMFRWFHPDNQKYRYNRS